MRHRIRISEGNRKLGSVPSVSLPPVVTCGVDIPCANDCYVVRNMLGGPYKKTIAKSYRANLEFIREDIAGFFDQLNRYIERRTPEFFRFHVSGDFISYNHLGHAFLTAEQFPNTRFLSFSKRFDLFGPAKAVPDNFSLIASMWPGWGSRPDGYRAAWMQDGSETRIPDDAIECPGACDTCGMCWSLPKLGRDVVFPKH